MPRFFYHGTTRQGYEAIQKDGFIKPSTGNTYESQIFLTNNEQFALRVTHIKHASYNGEELFLYKLPKYLLKKKYLTRGDKHISNMISLGEKTWCYSEPISIDHPDVLVSDPFPFVLNLPEGVSIHREGKGTGFSFTPEAAEKYGIELGTPGVVEGGASMLQSRTVEVKQDA